MIDSVERALLSIAASYAPDSPGQLEAARLTERLTVLRDKGVTVFPNGPSNWEIYDSPGFACKEPVAHASTLTAAVERAEALAA